MAERIKLGISRCLLGDPVRWDGVNKRDDFIADIMGAFIDYVPVCPEVEIGLSVPREPLRLSGTADDPHLITESGNVDYTDPMNAWINTRLDQLSKENLCGFIFKSKSPSCGTRGIPVYNGNGFMQTEGSGLFAAAFTRRFPMLPVADESELQNLQTFENFLIQVYSYRQQIKVQNEY